MERINMEISPCILFKGLPASCLTRDVSLFIDVSCITTSTTGAAVALRLEEDISKKNDLIGPFFSINTLTLLKRDTEE